MHQHRSKRSNAVAVITQIFSFLRFKHRSKSRHELRAKADQAKQREEYPMRCHCGTLKVKYSKIPTRPEWEKYIDRSLPTPHTFPITDAYDGQLHAESYFEDDLAKLLIDYSRRPLENKLSREEIAAFKRPLPEYVSKKQAQLYTESFFEILDKAFFLGAIRNELCDMIVLKQIEAADEYVTLAYFSPRSRRICIRFEELKDGPPRRLRDLISDLPHEMLHAFLDMYTCNCKACHDAGKVFDPADEAHYQGHRENWVNSYLAIEQVLKRTLSWTFESCIEHTVNIEIWKTSWRPPRATLEAWAFKLTPGNTAIYEMEDYMHRLERLLRKQQSEGNIEVKDELSENGRVAVKKVAQLLFLKGPDAPEWALPEEEYLEADMSPQVRDLLQWISEGGLSVVGKRESILITGSSRDSFSS